MYTQGFLKMLLHFSQKKQKCKQTATNFFIISSNCAFVNFGDKFLHQLKTPLYVLILRGCRPLPIPSPSSPAACRCDGIVLASISLAQASAPHTKHDKLGGGLLSFITWAVISVSADKIAVTKHARLLTALAAQINSRPLPTQVRWSWTNAIERLLHFWPLGAVFELLLLSQAQADCLIWLCGLLACAQPTLNWRQMQTWKACFPIYANIHRMCLVLVLFCSLATLSDKLAGTVEPSFFWW